MDVTETKIRFNLGRNEASRTTIGFRLIFQLGAQVNVSHGGSADDATVPSVTQKNGEWTVTLAAVMSAFDLMKQDQRMPARGAVEVQPAET
jgi:hypothetical protein